MRSLSWSGGSPARLPVSFFILSAVRQQDVTVSPMRPMACASEEYMLSTPRSCSTSSAAWVSARMRDWAKATSSGLLGLRWWVTIVIQKRLSLVSVVYGRVGLVEEGSTFGNDAIAITSG